MLPVAGGRVNAIGAVDSLMVWARGRRHLPAPLRAFHADDTCPYAR
jgi:hypothetical protein